jgi:heavy metal sensor kinase
MILHRLNIRHRLILWNTSVLMIILIVIFLGIYFFMHNRLESMVQNRLDSGYKTIEDVIINSRGDICDFYHLGQNILYQVKRDGKVVYQTEMWEEAQWTAALEGKDFDSFTSLQSEEGRLYKLKRGTVPEYDLEVVFATDATDSIESNRNLALILIAGIPGALILALLGGYFLAGRALSPIKAITRKAQEITAESLSERLPVQNPHDEIGHLATVFNDTLARIENSFQQLRRFTADASHELRTPLTSIRSVGEVALQKSVDQKTYQEAIGSMLEETERLTHLVDNLLVLARGDAGKARLNPHSTDLGALVRAVVDELRILAEEKNQTLSVSFQPSIMVTIDAATIRQALSNVLHNSIMYTQQGGQIDVLTSKTEDGHAVVDVIDNGPGIPAFDRSKVFERFYRIDKARSRVEGGVGLGLAIARWAVEVNAGAIAFRDKEGPGTHCRLTLPAAP